jgi:hypothetical protein
MIVQILKIASQLLALSVGVVSVIQAHWVPTSEGDKKHLSKVGWLTLAMFLVGFFSFLASDASQRDTIAGLEHLNKNLLTMRADHDLSGIEISFKPSDEQWSRITQLYGKMKSPVGEAFPYSAATMKAEKEGDRWKIDFGPVSRKEGTIRFSPIPAGQENTKPFEDVIHEASIPLWIKWGAGIETEMEPLRYEYASAIMVSQEMITLTLRPPMMKLNVNSFNANPTIILRSRNDGNSLPKSLKFHSLDSVTAFDQTIDLDWKKEERGLDDGDDYIKKTKPYITGPYKLQVAYRGV